MLSTSAVIDTFDSYTNAYGVFNGSQVFMEPYELVINPCYYKISTTDNTLHIIHPHR